MGIIIEVIQETGESLEDYKKRVLRIKRWIDGGPLDAPSFDRDQEEAKANGEDWWNRSTSP